MGNKVNWGFGHGVVLRAEVWLSSRKELREIGTVGLIQSRRRVFSGKKDWKYARSKMRPEKMSNGILGGSCEVMETNRNLSECQTKMHCYIK